MEHGKKVWGVVLVVAMVLVMGTGIASAATVEDSLHGAQLNPILWTRYSNVPGSITPTEEGVYLSIEGGVYPWSNTYRSFYQGLRFKCTVSGDFDIKMDYSLVDWPRQNGIRLGIGTVNGNVNRTSGDRVVVKGDREVYASHFIHPFPGFSIVDTTDMQGKLRIMRSGNTISAYTYSNGGWRLHQTAYTYDTSDTGIGLNIWGHYRTPGVTVKLENFRVTADEIVCPVIPVAIDIKPGSFPNSVNPRSRGVVPVAVLSTEDFDATSVNPLSVQFGPEGAYEAHDDGHAEDVNGDGYLDLVLHFRTQETGIACGQEEAWITGVTFDGFDVEGYDSVRTSGCK